MDDLLEYKQDLVNRIRLESNDSALFEEEGFFKVSTDMMSEAGILDNVAPAAYRNSSKGMKVDGYSWNELERTLTGIVVSYDGDEDYIGTISRADILKLSKNVERFVSKIDDPKFLDSLEESTDRVVAEEMAEYLDQVLKYRVVVLTDNRLSDRVKKIEAEPIRGTATNIEVWALERIRSLDESETESEPFTVDFSGICDGLQTLPANVDQTGASTYLCVMPATVLSKLYDEFGQRLLEANVRTFLDFRSSVNNGIRKALLSEPQNFFSYNNGLTCTATSIVTEQRGENTVITSLDNMQIVNGGQTTAAIYFAPKEKGGIGDRLYKDIDLEKVYVQMKLTVIYDESIQDILKSNISQYANTQNSIQKSDLVSNHPFHLNLEKLSRSIPMPAGKAGVSTKWFYERARGQYGTKIRALKGPRKRQFELEYPKSQKFVKTEMAKYENTWRMKPYEVKKGNEANLKLLGSVIVEEYEKDESQFKHSFYKDLISKSILFKESDAGIAKSAWYKEDRGLKAETVTYTIAYLRHKLKEKKEDINLSRIFNNQSLSDTLLMQVIYLARLIREKIQDPDFRGGVSNPSEFCKSKRGWDLIAKLDLPIDLLDPRDILSVEEQREQQEEKSELDKAGAQIEAQTGIMDVTKEEWSAIKDFYLKQGYPNSHKNVSLPNLCYLMYLGRGLPTDKQSAEAIRIRKQAYKEGFDFINN